jgi:hypothetical protein
MRPAGIAKATKNNRDKHPQQRDEWMVGKKFGRPEQYWVWDDVEDIVGGAKAKGHWEKR